MKTIFLLLLLPLTALANAPEPHWEIDKEMLITWTYRIQPDPEPSIKFYDDESVEMDVCRIMLFNRCRFVSAE
jgi:hypothetical protein